MSTTSEDELATTPGEPNSRRQRHPRALDDEELFIVEAPKNPLKAGDSTP